MILKHIRLSTAWNRFYHAMIIKKEDEPEPANYYISVFMTWNEYEDDSSKYKVHFRGTSENDVIDKLKDFLARKDKTKVSSILRLDY